MKDILPDIQCINPDSIRKSIEPPPNPERLRQLICGPYRIVHECVGEECRILSIRHGRMLVTADDARWN